MSSYLRSVVTWDERQTHRGCVRRVSSSSRTYISIYMAIIWGSGEGSVGGRGRGWGLSGHSVQALTDALERICGNL